MRTNIFAYEPKAKGEECHTGHNITQKSASCNTAQKVVFNASFLVATSMLRVFKDFAKFLNVLPQGRLG